MAIGVIIARSDRSEQSTLIDNVRTLAVAMAVAVTRCRVWNLYLMAPIMHEIKTNPINISGGWPQGGSGEPSPLAIAGLHNYLETPLQRYYA